MHRWFSVFEYNTIEWATTATTHTLLFDCFFILTFFLAMSGKLCAFSCICLQSPLIVKTETLLFALPCCRAQWGRQETRVIRVKEDYQETMAHQEMMDPEDLLYEAIRLHTVPLVFLRIGQNWYMHLKF